MIKGKNVWVHLNEFPDYYTKLEKMDEEAKEYWRGNDYSTFFY